MKPFLLLFIAAAFTLSCTSANNPQPPNPTVQAKIYTLQNDIRHLKQEVTESRIPEREDNICGRSPAIQRAILAALAMSRCSDATVQELFRIEVLELNTAKPFKTSDFDGLANLSWLELEMADPCGQWDDLTFTDSVVSKLPSLGHFELKLFREKLYPDAASAEDIADAVFLAINEGIRTESDERYSESNQDKMEARYRSGGVNVDVYIRAEENLYPCRRGIMAQ
jgi:hypothetical protein